MRDSLSGCYAPAASPTITAAAATVFFLSHSSGVRMRFYVRRNEVSECKCRFGYSYGKVQPEFVSFRCTWDSCCTFPHEWRKPFLLTCVNRGSIAAKGRSARRGAVVAMTFFAHFRDSRKSHEAMIGKERSVISGARLEFCANAFCLALEGQVGSLCRGKF